MPLGPQLLGLRPPCLPRGPTCRVGSREARWVSCSLNAFSFSSCWLQQNGRGTAFVGQQGALWPQGTPMCPGRGGHPGRGLSLRPLTSARLSGASSSSRRAAPANGTATPCPAATPCSAATPSPPATPALPCPCIGQRWAQGTTCGRLPRTCMRPKRELMAASSSLALLRTSSIMALRRTMASRVEVCSSFTACPGAARWLRRCGQHRTPTAPPGPPSPCPPSLPGPAAGSPACMPSRCRCSVLGSPCGHRRQRTGRDGAWERRGARAAHPCMSLKQLMQSMDFFSVENMM